jgi:hypothetical protein
MRLRRGDFRAVHQERTVSDERDAGTQSCLFFAPWFPSSAFGREFPPLYASEIAPRLLIYESFSNPKFIARSCCPFNKPF